ncbi:dipeptidyl-peptidase III [Gonapodya prolifera JEL478]|uniref:Dipeptidyl peptidase 3 n=1 Tax=Gonapodya prolifera (strain JEL478) TaxID=1344416 RepID=A0A139APS5_GONPJ|nr:dipeptidyl-peptidase III [Gonapodya prolifera JEL478]|eukprot:KXS18732.1 dipeptidyl-peptidase III [Gonapodya prolifera JEL478]
MTSNGTAAVPPRYFADKSPPVAKLEAADVFGTLSDNEKLYAHHLARAAFEGTRIILRQCSVESESIFDLILALFSRKSAEQLKRESGVSDDDWSFFLEYVTQVLSNNGNYKSFGDTIFVPRISEQQFERVVAASGSEQASSLFKAHSESIYASHFSEARRHLGFLDEGHHTSYYSGPITQAEIDAVQKVIEANNVSPLNTRLSKTGEGSFVLKVASANKEEPKKFALPGGGTLTVEYGDHSKEMAKIATEMKAALKYAPNENARKMIEAYIASYETGDMEAHKESQRWWIKDIGPVVESNIGFVETYRDPAGVRAEWEGFVAVVNKERTRIFQEMVQRAPEFISQLPWPSAFEKDVFSKPDFTSLEVLAFATGGVPAGINIPNYDDIRETLGFKNVSLGNVLNAKVPSEKLSFLTDADADLMQKLRGPAFEVQVGIHELLGHGTGKLLSEESPGKFNFDKDHPPVSPIDGKPVSTYYKAGETWSSIFGSLAASYEECRAEAVAMYLSTSSEMLEIFGHKDEAAASDVMYISWLMMARAGVLALEYYEPKKKVWGQAHMRGRYALFQCFLRAGDNFVRIEEKGDDLVIHMDRSKIHTTGFKAVGSFLQKLHIYKCSGDFEQGKNFYEDYTTVPEEWAGWREIVLTKKMPRKIYVQGNTKLVDGKAQWVDYPATQEGVIQSWLDRSI